MAIDQTNVALDIAAKAVQETSKFLEAFEELEDILTQALEAGIVMANYDAALAESSVKHADGAAITRLATIVPALKTYLASTSVGAVTYKAALYKLKQ